MRIRRLAPLVLSTFLALGTWASDEESTPAVPLETPMPKYPAELLQEGRVAGVALSVEIDDKGAVTLVSIEDSTDSRFEATCEEAVRKWRFKPRTYFGRATAGYQRIVFVFRAGKVELQSAVDPNADIVPPRVLSRESPAFPVELIKSWNTGRVEIEFMVGPDGRIHDPKVITSTHPAFEAPAVAALLKWEFAPGTKDGVPTEIKLRQGIAFQLQAGNYGESFVVGKGRNKKLPEVLQVDVQAKPKGTVFAVHPFEHAVEQKRGSAQVKILVGPSGQVIASSILKASKPEFGLALAAAMEAWTFEPAKRDGKPSSALLNRKQEFGFRERDSAMDDESTDLAARIRKGRFEPANASALDSPLQPTFRAPPVYPTALLDDGKPGSAKIEIIVDNRGRAVLPRILEASEPEFGWAAATAAQRWLFNPPTVGGKPVEVRVVIPFKFTPPEPEEPTG